MLGKLRFLLLATGVLVIPMNAHGMHDHVMTREDVRQDQIMSASLLMLAGANMVALAFSGDTTAIYCATGATVCMVAKTFLDTAGRDNLALAVGMIGISALAASLKGWL